MNDIKSKRIKTDLWSNVRLTFNQTGILKWLILIVIGNVAKAYILYLEGIIILQLMKDDENLDLYTVNGLLIYLQMYEILGIWIRNQLSKVTTERISHTINDTMILHYWNIMDQAKIEWLLCQNSRELHRNIKTGVSCLDGTIRQISGICNPLFTAITSIVVIREYFKESNSVAYVTMVILMIGIISMGSRLLKWSYVKNKELNKKTEPIEDWLYNEVEIIPVSKINGRGDQSIKKIVETLSNTTKEYHNLNTQTNNKYNTIDTVQSLSLLIVIIWLAQVVDKFVLLVPICNKLKTACNRMWWIFHTIHNGSNRAARWTTFEDILKRVKFERTVVKRDWDDIKDLSTILGFDVPNDVAEICISGKSGSGKSTIIKKILARLYLYSNEIKWLYMDQRMKVIESSCVKVRDFVTEYLPKDIRCTKDTERQIIHWAEKLLISKVINLKTLDKPFSSPSGGEEKRIMILRTLLPLLMEISSVEIIFADEITAGLDNTSWQAVRDILVSLKERGIRIIQIDHHEEYLGSVMKLQVKMKDSSDSKDSKDSEDSDNSSNNESGYGSDIKPNGESTDDKDPCNNDVLDTENKKKSQRKSWLIKILHLIFGDAEKYVNQKLKKEIKKTKKEIRTSLPDVWFDKIIESDDVEC